MRRSSQEKLRGAAPADPKRAAGLRPVARWICLGLLAFGVLACGEDPVSPPAPAAVVPDWAQHLCRDWRSRDGSCDPTILMADFEECQRTQGLPEMERLRQAGRRNRAVHVGRERATNLCLELRRWVMTKEGRENRLAHKRRPAGPS